MTAQIRSLTPRQVLDKINRAELQSELAISRQMRGMPSEGWRTAQVINSHRGLTGDRYLLDDGIPVLRVVHTPPALRPSTRNLMTSTAACSFGDCQGDPACHEHCPEKPKGMNPHPNCSPGLCESKASCGDRECHGHPLHESNLRSVDKEIQRLDADLDQMNSMGKTLVLAAIGFIVLIAVFFG